jgi:hypothetical protein
MHFAVTLNKKGRAVRFESWPNGFTPTTREGSHDGFFTGTSDKSMEDARERATMAWNAGRKGK